MGTSQATACLRPVLRLADCRAKAEASPHGYTASQKERQESSGTQRHSCWNVHIPRASEQATSYVSFGQRQCQTEWQAYKPVYWSETVESLQNHISTDG